MEEDSSEGLMFPLFVRIVDDTGSPMIEVQYDDSLYSPELAGKIGRFMNTVIARFAEDGNQPLRRISLLDAEEEARLARLRTEPETVEVPEDTFFFTGLERSAAQYPDRTALIAADGTFTYREFDEMTDRVANALIKRGAKPGGKALVLLPRNSRALAAFFGASKAGLGYIPFDPAYPVDRVNMVIEDSEAQFVITNAEMLPRFEGRNAIDVEELLLETDTAKPRVSLKPENISYMIFTSGSTGRPKGVMLTHRSMAHYVADMPGKEMVNTVRAFCSVFCSITTLSFDVSVMEYNMTLSHGLTLVLASEAECNDPDKLARRMIETHADLISGTPSRINGLLRSDAFCDALRRNVQLVICGGEKYPEQLMLKLKTLVPRQINLYGPSEITISCNEHELTNDGFVSLGRPTPGVTEYIVDTDGNELPAGLVGELWIGGWGVGLGYNKLPEMTAERFISYHGDRIYKSGDYGRWLPNGYLEILGRKDNQIKLRGLRIELGEVETVLAQQPGMKEVAVKIEKINGIEHLCAWFTSDEKVDIPRLKTAMGRTLTPYMVPTAYRQMDKMPYTPNGKLDLKSLPAPEVLREAGDAPRTQAERDFCEIFGELLHLDHMTATENFFDLGGTSLLVTQVIIEAGKRGYSIVYADVFAHPTPRALAMLFEKDAKPEAEKADEDIEGYDYSAIHQLLAENTLDHFRSGAPVPLGDVLLTGATGYLGIHVLRELLEHTESRVYCLVRGDCESAGNRLKDLLMYYFESPMEKLFGKRIFPLEGDITNRDSLMRLAELPIDTVINCAASVKHFAHDDSIERINLGGVRNLIDFCLEKGAKLIQTSTTSVLGIAYSDHLPEKDPDEHTLYFGQDLTNQYVHSKFLAERAVLEAAVQKGLKAKIMRYGNLSARYHDGEFQINFNSNSAMGNLRALAILKCVAYDQLGDLLEFTPIDYAAKATVMLSQTPEKCVLFHVLSEQYIRQDHLFRAMQAMGHPIDYVERSDFEKVLSDAQNDPRKAELLTSLIAYNYGEGVRKRQIIPFLREHTLQVLYRLGFSWPAISPDYFSRFIDLLNGLGYFDDIPGQ